MNSQTIAIDTSNHTPRFHLLNQNSHDCYYDDLRYNEDYLNQNQPNSLSSPFKQHQSYSPIVRRDDPTIPLYATLKPKSILNNHQRQFSNNYKPFSMIHRNNVIQNTPPLPMPRKSNNHQIDGCLQGLPLPPPPPPPPPIHQPPIKPKRTFEYVIGNTSRDHQNNLHSESGTFLISSEDYKTVPLNYDTDQLLNMNYNNKILKYKTQNYSKSNQGSTTSLDEEDLDLNDLKDFEDVTFDNLRKPNEHLHKKKNACLSFSTAEFSNHTKKEPRFENESILYEQKLDCVDYKDELDTNNTNSEQSLLLKSSGSSSDDTINMSNNNKNKENNVPKSQFGENSKKSSKFNKEIKETEEINEKNATNFKIYEETEI